MTPGSTSGSKTERGLPEKEDGHPWALVTGGSRGIGRAVVLDLAARGWNVALGFLRNEEAAEEVASAVRALGREALLCPYNLIKVDERKELMTRVGEVTDHLEGLAHAAGLGAPTPAVGARPSRWQMAWDTHVGALLGLIEVGRGLLRDPSSVVAFSSLGAHRVMEGYASIGATKGALETLVRYLAVELAPDGVNVNCVRGGPVDTDSLRSFPTFDDLVEESRRRPSGRMGRPEDIAPLVSFLLSQDARWIRGQVIVADGGFGLF